MLNIGILGSTKGTDLPAIVESINNGELKGLARIAVVISDKKNSGILEKARDSKLVTYYFNPTGIERADYDRKTSEILDKFNIQLIALIGYMKLFSEEFVKEYKNKIMNIHPSLLPSFPGMDRNVHREVLAYGCKISGCTIFFVDEGKDTGPRIMQKEVPVYNKDNIDTLKTRVQKAEQEIYPRAIKLYAEGRLKIEGRKVKIIGED